MRITVLGAGLVGSAIIKDLASDKDFAITAIDIKRQALDKLKREAPIEVMEANLGQEGVISGLVADADLVVCAVPGFMGFDTLREVIAAGKDVVDISFFAEDPFRLDELAKSRGVTAVVDCGVAPGLSNILLGHAGSLLDCTERFTCYVGGLPKVRQWPFEYKAVFSPVDVLEEYTRPARLIEHGQEVVRPALSGVELLDFPGIGTLEAFNTDGLRTLRQTMDIPFMAEKTLRYPGHARLMRVFRDSGFFDTEPVEVGGQSIRPLDLTSRLLFDQWKLADGEEDLTVMQVTVVGEQAGGRVQITYDLFDTYDPVSRTTSMARTTGYTCAIVARQVASGLFARKGICPPEYVGRDAACFADL
ncbi:MAG TPA: NAD(P)-binding domain-containing protein, partial [Caldilineae bacterium]|nr:NAD(P)-binding domain-containing protein [Caldilineae bacterium]